MSIKKILVNELLEAGLTELERAKNNNKLQVTVIGDLILDEYLLASPERISREAPVLILQFAENFYRLGGAANAGINAQKLGAQVNLIGFTGQDRESEILQEICQQNNINLKNIKLNNSFTTLKTRILATNQAIDLASAGNTSKQQVLRIDKISRKKLEISEINGLAELIKQDNNNIYLLSDYNLGVLSPEIIKIINNNNYLKKAIVDPFDNFDRFKNNYLFTPNEPDTKKYLKKYFNNFENLNFSCEKNNINNLRDIYLKLKNLLGENSNFLITRGSNGMLLLSKNKAYEIPVFNKAEVFDVTGAGDTVSACLAVCESAGLDILSSVCLGNLAASIVIRKAGAETTNLQELKLSLSKLQDIYINSTEFEN